MELTPRLEAQLRLNAAFGVSTTTVLKVWEAFGEAWMRAPDAELAAATGDLDQARRLKERGAAFDARGDWEAACASNARVLTLGEPDYPQLLGSICDPPLVLYVQGRAGFNAAPLSLAFVGSRRPTPYGARMAKALATEAARGGAVIVSGLARGIDSLCHEAALTAEAPTWAVLGSGLSRLYPAENAALAKRIVEAGGCVMSEWPMREPPLDWHFPRRNRIISGLSWGTIVVEGRMRSGSLGTAKCAAEQGREVFAVPGPADSPLSAAPHLLLRQGACLVERMSDVWDCLPPGARPGSSLYVPEPAPPSEKRPSLSLEERKILELIGPDARTLDELGFASGLDLSRLSYIIFQLELRNLIISTAGQRYAKKGI